MRRKFSGSHLPAVARLGAARRGCDTVIWTNVIALSTSGGVRSGTHGGCPGPARPGPASQLPATANQ